MRFSFLRTHRSRRPFVPSVGRVVVVVVLRSASFTQVEVSAWCVVAASPTSTPRAGVPCTSNAISAIVSPARISGLRMRIVIVSVRVAVSASYAPGAATSYLTVIAWVRVKSVVIRYASVSRIIMCVGSLILWRPVSALSIVCRRGVRRERAFSADFASNRRFGLTKSSFQHVVVAVALYARDVIGAFDWVPSGVSKVFHGFGWRQIVAQHHK